MPDKGCHFAQIENDLALAWARLHLSPVESAVVLVLIAKTMGAYDPVRRCAGRKDVLISVREIAELCDFARQRVYEAVKRLVDRGIVYQVKRGKDGRGQRATHLGLCQDPRILCPSVVPLAAVDDDQAPAIDLEAALAKLSPEARASARAIVTRAGVTPSLEGAEL